MIPIFTLEILGKKTAITSVQILIFFFDMVLILIFFEHDLRRHLSSVIQKFKSNRKKDHQKNTQN